MKAFQNQFLNNKNVVSVLSMMSTEALKHLATDIKAQVHAGLMSDSEAHQKINLISGVLMSRECMNLVKNNVEDNDGY
jgi:hypothetical protein